MKFTSSLLLFGLLVQSTLGERTYARSKRLSSSRQKSIVTASEMQALQQRRRAGSYGGKGKGGGGKGKSGSGNDYEDMSGDFGEDDMNATALDHLGTADDLDDTTTPGDTLDNGDTGVDDLGNGNGSTGNGSTGTTGGGGNDTTGGDGSTGNGGTTDDTTGGNASTGTGGGNDTAGGDGSTGNGGTTDDTTGGNGSTGTGGGGDTTGGNGSTGTGDGSDGTTGSGNGSTGNGGTADGTTGGNGSTGTGGTTDGDDTDGSDGKGQGHAADSDGTWTGDTADGTDGDETGATTSDGDTGVVYGTGPGVDTLDETPGDNPNIVLAQCKVTDPNIEDLEDFDLAPKVIPYSYTVSMDGSQARLENILAWIEFDILTALASSNSVMACSNMRRILQADSVDGPSALRVQSAPKDVPIDESDYECTGICENILIRGGVTASAPEGTDLAKLQCDVLPVLSQALANIGVIGGLTSIEFESDALLEDCEVEEDAPPTATVANTAASSEQVPAGVVVGAALGGMCLVLVGLLIVRQRMIKKRRDDGTQMTKDTKPIDDNTALEMTVDANETQTTSKYLSPKATESSDSTILGISSSPGECSGWGDDGTKGLSHIENDDDIESPPPQNKSDPEPSDFTFGDDSEDATPDPPSMDVAPADEGVPFSPNVHEEEHLMHDVDLMPEDEELHEGLAEA